MQNLFTLNRSLLLKHCWEVVSLNYVASKFLYACFLPKGIRMTGYYKKCSIWFGLKRVLAHIVSNEWWLIGDGKRNLFWHDNWLGEPLFKSLGAPASSFPRDKVSDYLHVVIGTSL